MLLIGFRKYFKKNLSITFEKLTRLMFKLISIISCLGFFFSGLTAEAAEASTRKLPLVRDHLKKKPMADELSEQPKKKIEVQYVLHARPFGDFGKELSLYWFLVNANPNLRHEPSIRCRSHCCLTAFFKSDLPEDAFIWAVKMAKKAVRNKSKKVIIGPLVQTKESDFIQIESPFLFAFARAFAEIVEIDPNNVKDPAESFHRIVLRNYAFTHDVKKRLKAIHCIQNRINLDAKVEWRIFVYRLIGKRMEVVTEISL